jgi:hypothetical protein
MGDLPSDGKSRNDTAIEPSEGWNKREDCILPGFSTGLVPGWLGGRFSDWGSDADGSDRSLQHAQPFCPLEIWPRGSPGPVTPTPADGISPLKVLRGPLIRAFLKKVHFFP